MPLDQMQQLVRIIPADAGSTSGFTFGSTRFEDHPRGCGEHIISRTCPLSNVGSSPRMRGAHKARISLSLLGGIIPADAGSTST